MQCSLPVLRASVPFAAFVIGALYATWIFDWGFLSGHGPYWDHPQLWDLDRAQALIGWRYFAKDAWRFPLFFVPSLAYPEGTNIVFTDSIPLLALPFKLLRQGSGVEVNYFGLWILCCYALQGLATALLLQTLGVRSPTIVLAAVLVTLSAPILLLRFGHGALNGHFLIILALREYFLLVAAGRSGLRWAAFGALVAATALVTAYFTVMTGALLLAGVCEALRRRTLDPSMAAVVVLGTCVTLALVLYGSGMIGHGAPSSVGSGFGHFSMNLLAPFFGDESSLTQRFFGPVVIDATRGQYEGFCYLGAGPLLLAISALVRWPRDVVRALANHRWLAFVLAGLTVYAVSNVGFAGSVRLYEIPLPAALSPLAGTFRSSGRFSWPACYAITLSVVAFLAARLPPLASVVVLVSVAALQLSETRAMRESLAHASSQANKPYLVSGNIVDEVRSAERLFFYPSFECSRGDSSFPHPDSWGGVTVEMMLLASQAAIPSNSTYVNRWHKDCAVEDEIRSRSLEQGTLYIVRVAEGDEWATLHGRDTRCIRKEPALLCRQSSPGD